MSVVEIYERCKCGAEYSEKFRGWFVRDYENPGLIQFREIHALSCLGLKVKDQRPDPEND